MASTTVKGISKIVAKKDGFYGSKQNEYWSMIGGEDKACHDPM
jgi:hypothetical protein